MKVRQAHGKTIALKSADGFELSAYHVAAQGPRRGGLVLIQEIFGVTDHIRDVCDGWAADGFEVVAPSVYDRVEKGFTAGYDQMERAVGAMNKIGPDAALADVSPAVEFLKARGPVFITGYCYGGSVAYVAACRMVGLAASAGYYGRLIPNYLGETIRVPTILHFGDTDASIPFEAVRKIQAAQPGVRTYIYRAGHGFCSDRPTHFNAAACALARQRTLAHFERFGAKA